MDLGSSRISFPIRLLDSLMNIAVRYRDRIDPSLFLPQVNWRNATNRRETGTAPANAIAEAASAAR